MSVRIFRIISVLIITPVIINALSLEVSGGTPQLKTEIENMLGDLSSKGVATELIVEKIGSFLKNRGYFSSSIKMSDDKLTVDAGSEYRIENIDIRAEKPVSQDWVISLMNIRAGDVADISKIEKGLGDVVSAINALGYYHPVIDYNLEKVSKDRVSLFVDVKSGHATYIKDIRFSGVSVFSEKEVLNETGLSNVQGAVKPDDVSCAVSRIYKLYRDAGYGNCKVNPVITDIDENGGMRLIFYIDEGGLNLIKKIVITGNKKTRELVLLREVPFKPGDVLRERDVRRAKIGISKLPFIRGTPEILYENGIVNIRVKEGRSVLIDGGLGISPGGESSNIVGDMKFKMTNIAGTGRTLYGSFASWGENVLDVSASYTETWVFNMPVDIATRFAMTERSTYRKLGIEGGLVGKLTGVLSLVGGGGFEKTERTAGTHTDDYYGYSGLVYNSIPNGEVPKSGSKATFRLDYGIRKIVGFDDNKKLYRYRPDSLARVRWTGDIERYISAGLFVPYIRACWGLVHIGSGGLDDGDLFEIGGAGSLRGYRRGAFLSDRFAVGTGELHIMMGGRAFIYPLVDCGIMHETDGVKTKVGYGVGLGADVGLGLLDISYVIGEGAVTNGMLNISMEMW
jgi:outer membrane protein assembly factor BamA